MPFASDDGRILIVLVMGSLSCLRSSREVSQEWVVRFLEHRIDDRRILRLVQKWLKAGVLEEGIVDVE